MRLVLLAASVLLGSAAACVDVPPGVRAQFAAPGPVDRSNYRQGNHGLAPPADVPEAPAAVKESGDPTTTRGDGGADAPASAVSDGGVS